MRTTRRPQPQLAEPQVFAPLHRLRAIAVPVLGAGGLAVVTGAVFWPGTVALALVASGCALVALALTSILVSARAGGTRDVAVLARLMAMDPDTLILTDQAGQDLPWRPGATAPEAPITPAGGSGTGLEVQADPAPTCEPAVQGSRAAQTPLRDQLSGWCADPDQVVRALLVELAQAGSARLELQRGAAGLRLSVHPLDAGRTCLMWRLSRTGRTGTRGLDALGLPVLTLGATGDPVAANPALLRLLDTGLPKGAAAAPVQGAALTAALAPLMAQLGSVADMAARAGNRQAELRLPGGQLALAQAVPARDGQCDILFLPGSGGTGGLMTRDLHGPQDYEDIPVALLQLDGDGRIYGTNRAARSLMGLSAAEDRPLWEVVEGLGRPVADWLQDARAGRALNRPEVVRATCAGGETFVQIILRRASDAAPPGALVAVVSDATELKILEARFVQSQKMQAIGQLAGGIAHDFNNLLTAISGHCDLLLLGLDPYDPDYNDLLQIHQNANRAAALVRQLLAFSRKQTLQPEVLTLEDLLEDVVHLLTRLVGERIQLSLRHDPHLGPIRADRRQLEQVIVNLVVNARDAMPMGGEIRIETQALILAAETPVGRVRLPAGTYARIQVIDTGIGIAPDLIDKIFEPFFTTKRQGEGTGLGLSTAYGIVKQMGGYIFVDSVEGSGTTFSLYFAADYSLVPTATPDPRVPARPSALSPSVTKPVVSGTSGGVPASARSRGGQLPSSRAVDEAGLDPLTASVHGEGLAQQTGPIGPALPVNGRAGEGSSLTEPDETVPTGAAQRDASLGPVSPGPRPPTATPPVATVRLPRPPSAPAAPVPIPSSEIAGIVLLVEDEAPVRAFAARALRLQGYRVLEAEDGEQALEVLSDPGLNVDIFVTDVIMPGRDGPTWVGEALRDRPGTPVVFVSGYIEDTLTEALGRTPRAVFLEKPFSLDALCRTIAAQLGQGTG
jgi:two-component system, cell cycle sensor histidine kinase and response regulator CckA